MSRRAGRPVAVKVNRSLDGACLCPGNHCSRRAEPGRVVTNEAGQSVAVCRECSSHGELTWESVLKVDPEPRPAQAERS